MKPIILLRIEMLILAFSAASFNACTCSKNSSSNPQSNQAPASNTQQSGSSVVQPADVPAPIPDTFEITDVKIGKGAEAVDGKKITVHYTGILADGLKFDSSLDRDAPMTFVLGTGQVIQGWDEGIKGMKVGGKRKLTIPPRMGYGARGVGGSIPPNAALFFDIELLKVE